MKKTILILAVAVAAAGCRDSSTSLRRDQQNYGVVQEGSAGAATSTLNAPGEAPPPMTATNVDTTSNLTLLPGTAGAPGQPGTIAGTMTSSPSGPVNPGYANDGSTASPRVRVAHPTATQTTARSESPAAGATAAATPPMTSATSPSSSTPATSQTSPSSASPSSAPAPPPSASPSTDTAAAAPTDTSDQKPKEKPKESKPSEAPPSTDTSTTTAPPPTQT